jgi:hypothetical protein
VLAEIAGSARLRYNSLPYHKSHHMDCSLLFSVQYTTSKRRHGKPIVDTTASKTLNFYPIDSFDSACASALYRTQICEADDIA